MNSLPCLSVCSTITEPVIIPYLRILPFGTEYSKSFEHALAVKDSSWCRRVWCKKKKNVSASLQTTTKRACHTYLATWSMMKLILSLAHTYRERAVIKVALTPEVKGHVTGGTLRRGKALGWHHKVCCGSLLKRPHI